MDSTKATAHRAGAVYFLFMIVAIIGEFLFPHFLVPGDAAATARNVADAEFTYRVGILLGFITHVIFIFLVVILYKLFKQVDEGHALLMVLLVSVGVAVALANLIARFAPLALMGDDSSSAFTKPQLNALALQWLSVRSSGNAFPMMFWGLWLYPFGMLVIKSGFLPRLLGFLILIAGVAYVTTGLAAVVFPEQRLAVSRFVMPLYFGEVPIVFWLLIKGASEPPRGT